MAFGINFGKNKTKVDSTTTVDKTENRNETGTQSTAGAKSSSTTGSQSSQGSSDTTSSQSSQNTGTTTGQGSQVEQTIRELFSSGVMGGLEGAASQLLDTVGATVNRTSQGMSELGGFNPEEFVAKGMAGATSRVNSQLDEAVGSLFSSIGGTSGSNSAAALLEQRLQGDAASQLAGIESQLVGQGEEIQRANLTAAQGLGDSQNALMQSILGALRGATETTTGVSETTTTEANQNTQTQTGQQSTATQQDTATQQSTVETVLEQILKTLTGTVNTQGTENTKGTTTEKGGGFGLSI